MSWHSFECIVADWKKQNFFHWQFHHFLLISKLNQIKIWSSHLLDNLSNCLMSLKNSGDSTGFEPMTSAMPVQCSNQLSYEVTQWRAGQFVGLIFSRERNVIWKKCYMQCGVWNQMKISNRKLHVLPVEEAKSSSKGPLWCWQVSCALHDHHTLSQCTSKQLWHTLRQKHWRTHETHNL